MVVIALRSGEPGGTSSNDMSERVHRAWQHIWTSFLERFPRDYASQPARRGTRPCSALRSAPTPPVDTTGNEFRKTGAHMLCLHGCSEQPERHPPVREVLLVRDGAWPSSKYYVSWLPHFMLVWSLRLLSKFQFGDPLEDVLPAVLEVFPELHSCPPRPRA